MRYSKTFFLIILLAILFAACKKEHLQPNNNTGSPVFYFNGTVSGQAVSLRAGVNNYYMYSLYLTDANNLLNYVGTLQQVGCQSCSNSISISIKDYKIESNYSPDSSLVQGYYPYESPSGGTPTAFSASFSSHTQDSSVTSYNWNFGDGRTSSYANPEHTFTHPGNYNVMLQVTAACNGAISNPLNIGTPLATFVPRIIIAHDSIPKIISLVASVSGGTQPYKYFWNFGDSTSSTSSATTHYYNLAGMYQISLTVTDAAGLTSTVSVDTNTFGYSPECVVNFASSEYAIPNPNALSNIVITYNDASGNTYSSANVIQPSSSYFKLLNVAAYQNNQNNLPTLQLHIQFSCMVQDGAGNKIPITNGDAVIAVAYK